MLMVYIRHGFNQPPLVNIVGSINEMRMHDENVYRNRTVNSKRQMQFEDRIENFYETRIDVAQICRMGVCYVHAL